MAGAKPDRALWKKAHQLLVHAFHAPPADADKKKLAKILRRPAPDEVAAELFSYDGFLRGLGRMSLSAPPPPRLPLRRRLLTDPRPRPQTSRRTAACTRCTRT